MNELDYLNYEEDLNKIGDITERKQKLLNELYNYISAVLNNNYYNYIDLLNDKDIIIQQLLSKYNITEEKDIAQIYSKFDAFYRRLKNQANEARKFNIKKTAMITELIGWAIIAFVILWFFSL